LVQPFEFVILGNNSYLAIKTIWSKSKKREIVLMTGDQSLGDS